jgi:hypothetical protein
MAIQDTLKILQSQMPQLDLEAKKRSDQARTILAQNQLGQQQLVPGQTAAQAAQAVTPQLAQQTAEANVQQTQKSVEDTLQLEQQRQIAVDQQRSYQLEREKLSIQEETDNKKARIASLGSDLQKKLFDDTMKFEKDEAGRKFSNERQLQDWAILSAKNQEEAKSRLQTIQLMQERKVKLLEVAHQRVVDTLERGWKTKEQKLDQETRYQILAAKQALEEKIAKQKAKASMTGMLIKGGLTIAGAAAGAVVGSVVPGAGTMAGAALGASIGGSVGDVGAGIANS